MLPSNCSHCGISLPSPQSLFHIRFPYLHLMPNGQSLKINGSLTHFDGSVLQWSFQLSKYVWLYGTRGPIVCWFRHENLEGQNECEMYRTSLSELTEAVWNNNSSGDSLSPLSWWLYRKWNIFICFATTVCYLHGHNYRNATPPNRLCQHKSVVSNYYWLNLNSSSLSGR